jgi:hypothetical protein
VELRESLFNQLFLEIGREKKDTKILKRADLEGQLLGYFGGGRYS